MDSKKWPILAQVLIALGIIASLMNIVRGLLQKNILSLLLSIIGIVIWWSVYKFKKWALAGISIFLSLNIILTLIGFLSKIGGGHSL